MRRADRLFQILTLLRNRRTAITAGQLAETLEVSERTIYRDIQSLIYCGTPIEGEAGVGYRLSRHFDLPPLMFSTDEVEALLLGTRMVQAWSDRQMASAADTAMQKILAALPDNLRHRDEQLALLVPDCHIDPCLMAYSDDIRRAIKNRCNMHIQYCRADGEQSERRVQPLGLIYWGRVWTLVAWCELRNDYRTFRLDRIQQLISEQQQFETGPKKSLKHYLDIMEKADDQLNQKSL